MTDILISAMDIIAAERYARYTGEEHKFSKRFERRIRRLSGKADIKLRFGRIEKRVPFRKAVTFAVIVVLTATVSLTAIGTHLWDEFAFDDYDTHTDLFVIDYENAPTQLEDTYRITADMSEYTLYVRDNDEICYIEDFTHIADSSMVTFQFSTKEYLDNTRINTEDALTDLTYIEINGNSGLFFQNLEGGNCLIWTNADYGFLLAANSISKNELIFIAESVQKVE